MVGGAEKASPKPACGMISARKGCVKPLENWLKAMVGDVGDCHCVRRFVGRRASVVVFVVSRSTKEDDLDNYCSISPSKDSIALGDGLAKIM